MESHNPSKLLFDSQTNPSKEQVPLYTLQNSQHTEIFQNSVK